MNVAKDIANFKKLHTEPLWRLLAVKDASIILALLEANLYGITKVLPYSVLNECIERDLEELRANGEDLPHTAQTYIANWLRDGFLECRFPLDASEEIYALSMDTIKAIRFVKNIERPLAVIESRLSIIIYSLTKLVKDTETKQFEHINVLHKERELIDKKIDKLCNDKLGVLSDVTALEFIREIISLINSLTEDLHLILHQLKDLDRNLRMQLMDSDKYSEVLNKLSTGVNLIGESEIGEAFTAYWKLLENPKQALLLEQAIAQIMGRNFSKQLTSTERDFLLNFPQMLLVEQGGTVNELLQNLDRDLKSFVNSPKYTEEFQINQLLKTAQQAALAIKDDEKATEAFSYELEVSECNWVLSKASHL